MIEGGDMDFSARLDALQALVAEAREEVRAAAAESRAQLKTRLDQAQNDLDQAAQDARQ